MIDKAETLWCVGSVVGAGLLKGHFGRDDLERGFSHWRLGLRHPDVPAMNVLFARVARRFLRNVWVQASGLVLTVSLMGNLSALADLFLQPEVPYLNERHFVAGAVTAAVSAALLSVLLVYVRHLEHAQDTIRRLESLLPICADCKKIRETGGDPLHAESWHPMETYILEKTGTRFSHGLCPDCAGRMIAETREADFPGRGGELG